MAEPCPPTYFTGLFSVPSPGVMNNILLGWRTLAVCQVSAGTSTNDPG